VDPDLVFTNDGGLPLVAVTLRKYLYRVLEQAGLPGSDSIGCATAWRR
jgi:hypothetical protein